MPVFRGAAETQSGYWESFTSAYGSPGNLPGPGGSTGARLIQSNTNALITGSGNIYNVSDLSAFILEDTPPFPVGTVVMQVRTIGSELDYDSVALVYTNDTGLQRLTPSTRYELDRSAGQGSNVSALFQWDLRSLGVQGYQLVFNAAGPSLSLDSLTLDTAAEFARAFEGAPFGTNQAAANIARWMYPFNADPGGRGTASVFGALGSSGSFDSRDAQYVLAWDTTNVVPAGQGATNYLVRRARVTLTIASGNQYAYTGTLRDYRSYFPKNDPRYLPPTSSFSPVELYGTGFRGGFTPETFEQTSPYYAMPGAGNFENRTAFAAGFNTNGLPVDISNNVGDDGTNEIAGAFEVAPFAVGQSSVTEGELMPAGSTLIFDLNLADPFVARYIREALDKGRLHLTVASLASASLGGPPSYPNFYTVFSPIATPAQYPNLDLEVAVIRRDRDTDSDGLPDDWENFHFGTLAHNGASDPDNDGASNAAELSRVSVPDDPGSSFQITSLERKENITEVWFNFAQSGDVVVETSGDLANWETSSARAVFTSDWLSKSGTNITYPAPVYGLVIDTNSVEGYHFYRLKSE